jgi:cytochrome c553
MKRTTLFIGTAMIAIFMASPLFAAKSSVKQGESLFNDPSLSGSQNDKSCASCHPGGDGLEKAGSRKDLTKIINQCIIGALQGEKIDFRSVDGRSLKMYVQSLMTP